MSLEQLIGLSNRIEVADIGAAVINEAPVYRSLLASGLAHLHAFEGDQRQVEKLGETYGEKVTVYSVFLGDGEEHTLHIANPPTGMTSLLKPDVTALRFFNGFEGIGKILGTQQVATQRLDDVSALPKIDFLKMDVQGSELMVLQHGTESLSDCVALQVEVSFICLYENQPAFGDIDLWMRSQGFVPHCYLDLKRWSIAPTIFKGSYRTPGNQLLEADIVYVKDPLRVELYSDLQLRKLAALSHFCFQSADLCAYLIEELVRRQQLPPNSRQQYYQLLTS